MTIFSLGLFLCVACAAEPPKSDASKSVVLHLCAEEEWYQKAKGEEKSYEGLVERNSGGGQVGPTRFNSYRLSWNDTEGNQLSRELYTPGKAQLLAVHLGKRVRVIGKAIDTKADGKTYHELWPARLEALAALSPDMLNGIIARTGWQPEAARRPGASNWIIHDGTELAKHWGYFGVGVDQRATADLAKHLSVSAIDWKKQMLVSVSAGLRGNGERLRIIRVALKDKVLVVTYRVETPSDGITGISYPSETVLVDRFDVEVRFEAEETGKK